MSYYGSIIPPYEMALIALAKNPELRERIMPEGGGIDREEFHRRLKDKLPIEKYAPSTVQRELERLESIGPLKEDKGGKLIWGEPSPNTPLRFYVRALRDRLEDNQVKDLDAWALTV